MKIDVFKRQPADKKHKHKVELFNELEKEKLFPCMYVGSMYTFCVCVLKNLQTGAILNGWSKQICSYSV